MYAIRVLNILVMLAVPCGLAAYINSKFKTNWQLWWIGGAAFVISQIGHIPFNYFSSLLLNKTSLVLLSQIYQTLFNAIFLGLSAGLWEETARYAAIRWWIGKARSWRKGIQLGVGHGGFESLILGLMVLYSFIQMVAIKHSDTGTLVPPEQLSKTIELIAAYWEMPWYDALMGGIERIMTLPIQIALSVIVMQVFIRKTIKWLWIAIIFHTIIDATSVLLIAISNVYIAELMIALFAMSSLGIIFLLKSPEPVEEDVIKNKLLLDQSNNSISSIKDLDESLENLEGTIFQ